jgi:hypothetical protein
MDSLRGLGVFAAATLAAGGARVSGNLGVAFGPRFWWYDVQQGEGAV